ncbi:MAG: lysophospholipid acyltransferase family protein [Candidatus Caccosoma sp.]|nr:lysophospholipid acyltransferase family protein [Candidatus Caccosoma sp.]
MKETLQEKLARRKYKIPNKFVYCTLNKLIINPFLAPKFHPTYHIIDNINDYKGPCFLIYNHQSRMDYIYIAQATYPRPLNFVVGYNEFFRSHLQFIFKLIHNIPKKNFNSDVASIRAMNQIIKQNGVVCIAPEGMSSITGHSQPIALGTGKLLKHYHIPVYMVKLKGAFLSNTKVCLDERYGKVDVTLQRLFDEEQLRNLSVEDIENKINEELWQDDYEWNKKERIKFDMKGNGCSHLHDLCYHCFKCNKDFTMFGEKDKIVCKECGNGATLNEYYDLIPFDDTCVIPESISKWVDEERRLVYHEIQDESFEFKEEVKIGKIPDDHYLKNQATSEICGEGILTINHEGFFYKGTKDNQEFEFKIDYNHLPTLGMPIDVTFFSIYHDGKYYDIFPKNAVVGKILLIVEEMHRLHVNAWKNFPWADTYK